MVNSGNAFLKPQRAAGYVRISRDPFGMEKGVTRQMEDIKELAARLGWTVERFYVENDTSAYKKRKVTLPDGSTAWRVVRPEFARMLQDLQSGEIDGIIVYDLDRLARQPRDLEDLIDLVEAFRRPVQGVTGNIDLMSSNGRAMARVLTAMANKSSEDTARRVARARLQEANEGRTHKARRFGRTIDGELIAEEAELLQWAARRLVDGESWTGTAKILAAGAIQPPGGRWYVQALRYMLLNPTVAGIAVYNGGMREHSGTRTTVESYITSALKHPDGSFVMTDLVQILTVEQWENLVEVFRAGREGKTFSGVNTKKYLLSGLLRCGKTRGDGTVCNTPLSGTRIADGRERDKKFVVYRCPGVQQGGCAGVSRRAALVDELVEDMLFAYLAKKAPRESSEAQQAGPVSNEQQQLDAANARLAGLRQQYATGAVSDETFFATVPLIEAEIKKLAKTVKGADQARPGFAPLRTAAQVRKAWDEADTAGKRAILGQYLNAIVVKPTVRGRAAFDHTAIVPKWKKLPSA